MVSALNPTNLYFKRLHTVVASGLRNRFYRMDEYSNEESAKYSSMYNKMFQSTRLPEENTPMVRSCTTSEICENLYCFIYMLDNYIVFGYDEAQKKWLYGAHPSQLSNASVHMMTPEQIMSAVRDLRDNPNQETHNPILQQMQKLSTPSSWANMLHTVDAAYTALMQNDKICKDIVPYIHPPPDTSHENRKRMREWAPLNLADFQRPHNKTLVAFSTKAADVSWLKVPEHQEVLSHGFMHSNIHLIKKQLI